MINEWYVPITILPSVGVLIVSTTNQMTALNSEIGSLLFSPCPLCRHEVVDLNVEQLRRLGLSSFCLYFSATLFVLSGILNALSALYFFLSNFVLLLGVFFLFVATVFLVVHGFKTIQIRKQQHQHNHELESTILPVKPY